MAIEWNYFVAWDMVLAVLGGMIIITSIRHSEKEVYRDALGRLRDLLIRSEEFDSSGILVREDDDTIVLFGSIRSEAAKQLSESVALSVIGGIRDDRPKISNQLVVVRQDDSNRHYRILAA